VISFINISPFILSAKNGLTERRTRTTRLHQASSDYLGSRVIRTTKLQAYFSAAIQNAHVTAFCRIISRKSNAQNYRNIWNMEAQRVSNISLSILATQSKDMHDSTTFTTTSITRKLSISSGLSIHITCRHTKCLHNQLWISQALQQHSPSWSPQSQSGPRTTLAPTNIPRASTFNALLLLPTFTLSDTH